MFYFSFTLICASSGKILAMEPPTQLSRQARRLGRGKDRELAWPAPGLRLACAWRIAWPARRLLYEFLWVAIDLCWQLKHLNISKQDNSVERGYYHELFSSKKSW